MDVACICNFMKLIEWYREAMAKDRDAEDLERQVKTKKIICAFFNLWIWPGMSIKQNDNCSFQAVETERNVHRLCDSLLYNGRQRWPVLNLILLIRNVQIQMFNVQGNDWARSRHRRKTSRWNGWEAGRLQEGGEVYWRPIMINHDQFSRAKAQNLNKSSELKLAGCQLRDHRKADAWGGGKAGGDVLQVEKKRFRIETQIGDWNIKEFTLKTVICCRLSREAEEALRVAVLAEEEAKRFNHSYCELLFS